MAPAPHSPALIRSARKAASLPIVRRRPRMPPPARIPGARQTPRQFCLTRSFSILPIGPALRVRRRRTAPLTVQQPAAEGRAAAQGTATAAPCRGPSQAVMRMRNALLAQARTSAGGGCLCRESAAHGAGAAAGLAVLCGPSHSGKPAFAGRFCKGFRVISSDRIRKERGTVFGRPQEERVVWEVFECEKRVKTARALMRDCFALVALGCFQVRRRRITPPPDCRVPCQGSPRQRFSA